VKIYKGSKTLGNETFYIHNIIITIKLKPLKYLVKYLLNSNMLSEIHFYIKNYKYLDKYQ